MANNLTTNQEIKVIHIRIWLSAFIASSIYIGINLLFFKGETTTNSTYYIEGLIFFVIWVIIHYLINRKKLKQLKSTDK